MATRKRKRTRKSTKRVAYGVYKKLPKWAKAAVKRASKRKTRKRRRA